MAPRVCRGLWCPSGSPACTPYVRLLITLEPVSTLFVSANNPRSPLLTLPHSHLQHRSHSKSITAPDVIVCYRTGEKKVQVYETRNDALPVVGTTGWKPNKEKTKCATDFPERRATRSCWTFQCTNVGERERWWGPRWEQLSSPLNHRTPPHAAAIIVLLFHRLVSLSL